MSELGWMASADGAFIQRLDDCGHPRKFELGADRFGVPRDWLHDRLRRRAFMRCHRIQRSNHRRDEEDLAQGLDLPGIPPGSLCTFSGHLAARQAATTRRAKHACFVTGASVWYEMAGKQLQPQDPRRRCMCDAMMPSHPHIMWDCPPHAGEPRSAWCSREPIGGAHVGQAANREATTSAGGGFRWGH